MGSKSIDRKNLLVTGANVALDAPHLTVDSSDEGVQVIVTQAFGPTGNSMVGISDVTFDGFPAVSVLVKAMGKEGLVHMSPFHGDPRKAGWTDIPVGTRCELFCPQSGKRLDHIGRVEDGTEADYYAIYLTPKLSRGEMVAISDIWGDYHSRIIDNFELISSWAAHEDVADAR